MRHAMARWAMPTQLKLVMTSKPRSNQIFMSRNQPSSSAVPELNWLCLRTCDIVFPGLCRERTGTGDQPTLLLMPAHSQHTSGTQLLPPSSSPCFCVPNISGGDGQDYSCILYSLPRNCHGKAGQDINRSAWAAEGGEGALNSASNLWLTILSCFAITNRCCTVCQPRGRRPWGERRCKWNNIVV